MKFWQNPPDSVPKFHFGTPLKCLCPLRNSFQPVLICCEIIFDRHR
ncbi:MAG: hypothetical protein GY795_45340 [Desulfobacterales bacterium]|nr:hypothetical protein [Desulfobacterales bacterium]